MAKNQKAPASWSFRLTFGQFTTRSGRKIRADGSGVFRTTNKAEAAEVARCMGVTRITDDEADSIQLAASAGERGSPVGTVVVDRSGNDDADAGAAEDPATGGEGEGDDTITADYVEHATKTELKDLLTGWEVAFKSRDDLDTLRGLAMDALGEPDGARVDSDEGLADAGAQGDGEPSTSSESDDGEPSSGEGDPTGEESSSDSDAPPFETEGEAGAPETPSEGSGEAGEAGEAGAGTDGAEGVPAGAASTGAPAAAEGE